MGISYNTFPRARWQLISFNYILDQKDNILIIDWLQWVPSDHPNAKSILERDLTNISNFFKKKYNVESNPNEIINSFYEN